MHTGVSAFYLKIYVIGAIVHILKSIMFYCFVGVSKKAKTKRYKRDEDRKFLKNKQIKCSGYSSAESKILTQKRPGQFILTLQLPLDWSQ